MANLPLKLDLPETQTRWASILNPIIANPILSGIALNEIRLQSGQNVINHKLQRKMQGWFITDMAAAATVYKPDVFPFNNLTLTLTASVPVTVNLWVY